MEGAKVVRLDADEGQKQNDSVVQDSENLIVECEMHDCKASGGETGDTATLEKVADEVPPLVVQTEVTEQGNSTTHSDSQVKKGTSIEVTITVHNRNIQDELPVHVDSNAQGSQSNISFQDITYKVKQTKHCRRIRSKVILNSVR